MKTNVLAAFAAGLVVFAITSIQAIAGTMYVTGVDSGATTVSRFGKINTVTGVYTEINANLGSSGSFNNLSSDVGGSVFYTTRNSTLYTIDTAGNVSSSISNLGYTAWAMAYNSTDDKLYGYNWASDKLTQIDPSTGASTVLSTPSVYASTPYYCHFAFIGNTLYSLGSMSGGVGRFGTYNPATGVFSQIASSTDYLALKLATDGENLYALNLTTLYTINPLTGALSNPVSISGTGWFTGDVCGAGFAVPEPATIVLLAAGGIALLRRKVKK